MSDSDAVYLSPFPQHLLESNDPPSEAEAHKIQAILDHAHTLLADLEACEDSALSYEDSEDQRSRIVQHIHQGRGLLSAVRSLPFDILSELFTHLHTRRWNIWLLAHVCRLWRATTRALPTLYAHIAPRFPLPAIAAHLELSCPCALHIDLGPTQTAALELVVPHAERWASLKIDMGPEMTPVLAQVRGRLPLLRRVEYRDDTGRGGSVVCSAFEIAPSLVEASIRSTVPVLLPWAQLERVFLQVLAVGLEPLAAATSLVELNLLTLFSTPPPPADAPICLPRLRRLFVHEGEALDGLVCPALEEILVAHDGDMRVLPFLERSACALCVFSTECQAVSAAGVAAVLELVPSLQELRVIGMHAVGELVSRLVVPRDDGAPVLGATLRRLALHSISTDAACAAVVQMMGSRRVEAMGARRCPALALCVLNYREFALSAEAVSAQALLRDEWGMEVEWRVSNDKIRSWELEYPW
ncbi:hypothetical protein DFH09DRAFT_1214670 [Mycena vulgaris]|nr:hypothetical protein DFH09DRAFT_1214670 [Mycena vulgaris]